MHTPTPPPAAAPGAGSAQLPTSASRRALLHSVAWSVPAISLTAAAPAFAWSSTTPNPAAALVRTATIDTSLATPAHAGVQRCALYTGGRLTFRATVNGVAAPVGSTATVTLPQGLEFLTPGTGPQPLQEASITVGTGGALTVPAFRATGVSGTYTVTAHFQGQSDTVLVLVSPGEGRVVEIRRSTTGWGTDSTFSTVAVGGLTAASAVAVQGDATTVGTISPGNGAALTSATSPTGQVRYWGKDYGTATVSAPATLTYGTTTVSGMTFVDVWTAWSSSTATTGGLTSAASLAASTSDTAYVANGLYQWYRTGGTTYVRRVAGPSGSGTTQTNNRPTGTVLSVHAGEEFNYVRTSAGIWRWDSDVTATGRITAVSRLVASSTGTPVKAFDAWSHSGSGSLRAGNAWVVGTTVTRNRYNGTTWSTSTTTLPSTFSGTVTRLVDTDAGTALLDSNGSLYVQSAAWGSTPVTGSSSWLRLATGVAVVSFWGYGGTYRGGIYTTTDGLAHQIFQFSNNAWSNNNTVRTGSSTGPALENVVQVDSADGTYLLLTSDGQVWGVGNNYDHNRGAVATPVVTGAGKVTSLGVWGFHPGSYHGGGHAVLEDAACTI